MQRAANVQAPQSEQLFLETYFGFTNDLYSTNCAAAQLRVRRGYCLKHPRIAGDMGSCIRRSPECLCDAGFFKHELHASAVAHAPTVHTPAV